MALNVFDDLGIRFEYPDDWELEVVDDDSDGDRATVTVQAADGLAFAMLTLDGDRPAPAELIDEALGAMREEYPNLEAVDSLETIGGHPAVGHDLEFLALDMPNSCVIRAFRTARRTILVFCQWSELDDEDLGPTMALLRKSLEETDA
jgi:hypothetical protein